MSDIIQGPKPRVLVCGGRDFEDWDLFDDTLCKLDDIFGFDTVISGGAKGADTLAIRWATKEEYEDLKLEVYPADWINHRKAAGPIRNQQMLDEGEPDLVVAFPGGTGTADMIRRAKKAGVDVIEITDYIYNDGDVCEEIGCLND